MINSNSPSDFPEGCFCYIIIYTICMGFGCNAAGVVGCRIIDSPRERLIAILTNSFVPCNGRFPTLIALITMFFVGTAGGVWQGMASSLLLTGAILLGVVAEGDSVGLRPGAAALPPPQSGADSGTFGAGPYAVRIGAGGRRCCTRWFGDLAMCQHYCRRNQHLGLVHWFSGPLRPVVGHGRHYFDGLYIRLPCQ